MVNPIRKLGLIIQHAARNENKNRKKERCRILKTLSFLEPMCKFIKMAQAHFFDCAYEAYIYGTIRKRNMESGPQPFSFLIIATWITFSIGQNSRSLDLSCYTSTAYGSACLLRNVGSNEKMVFIHRGF